MPNVEQGMLKEEVRQGGGAMGRGDGGEPALLGRLLRTDPSRDGGQTEKRDRQRQANRHSDVPNDIQ